MTMSDAVPASTVLRFPCSASKQHKLKLLTSGGVPPVLARRGMTVAEWSKCCDALNAVADANFFANCPALEALYWCTPGGPVQAALCCCNPCTWAFCLLPTDRAKGVCRAQCTEILLPYGYEAVSLECDSDDNISFVPCSHGAPARAHTAAAASAVLPQGEAIGDWQRCEAVLRTRRWQTANTATRAGIERRLEMMREAGLPEMKVISARTIEQLGRIPRSTEGYAVNAIDAVRRHGVDEFNYSKVAFAMFSHRWKRPLWCEALGRDVAWGSDEHLHARAAGDAVGDPDDASHSKAKALVHWVEWFKREVAQIGLMGTPSGTFNTYSLSPHIEEVYFWIDWPCVDQTNPAAGIAALPAYVSTCHVLVAAWTAEYANRAWCRVELLTAQAFMKNGDRIFVCEETSAPLPSGKGSMHKEKVQILPPTGGKITNEADLTVVERLQQAAFDSEAFTCRMICYTEMLQTSLCECLVHCLFCCGCFGIDYMERSRIPGQTRVLKLTPRRANVLAPHPPV